VANQLSEVYKAKAGRENQKAWVDAHNEATKPVLFARGDINQAKTLYPDWTGEEIRIV